MCVCTCIDPPSCAPPTSLHLLQLFLCREISELRHSLALSSSRLGHLKYERVGGGISGERVVEVWEDGFAGRELKKNIEEVKRRRVELEKRQVSGECFMLCFNLFITFFICHVAARELRSLYIYIYIYRILTKTALRFLALLLTERGKEASQKSWWVAQIRGYAAAPFAFKGRTI